MVLARLSQGGPCLQQHAICVVLDEIRVRVVQYKMGEQLHSPLSLKSQVPGAPRNDFLRRISN